MAVGKNVAVGRMVGGRVAVEIGVVVGADVAGGGNVRVARGGGVSSNKTCVISGPWAAGCKAVAETVNSALRQCSTRLMCLLKKL